MKTVFIVTSVIHAPMYSFFDTHTRILQTYETVMSIKRYAPGAIIIICEGSDYIWNTMDSVHILQCTPTVTGLNKNAGEASIVRFALQSNLMKEINPDRIFKLSGRYQLMHGFNFDVHTQSDKIVIRRGNSLCHVGEYYTITVLFSFHNKHIPYMLNRLEYVIQMSELQNIEHALFARDVLNEDMFMNIPFTGAKGMIAPCGSFWSG